MTLQEIREKTKKMSSDELKKYGKNMPKEDQELIDSIINMQKKINYTFKNDDFADYTEDEEEIKERIKNIEQTIKSYSQEDLDYTKDSLLNPYILEVLAHCIKDTYKDLSPSRLNELIDNYNKINHFIYSDENHEEVFSIYGDIVNKDDNGFYKINNAIVSKVLSDTNFNINKDLTPIKEAISLIWENKKTILNPKEINNISEKQNGINFKEFIFCEEYLKRGKIKPTCEYLGISRNTAYLWLNKDNVQKYLKQRQNEIKKETDNTFVLTYRNSFNELNNIINSTIVDTNDKLKAIDVFLKHYENIERLKQE